MNPTQFYKCLADENRLKSLLLLAELGPTCVCNLMAALNLDQPKTSRHLAQLRRCGVVEAQRHGKWMFYRLSETLPSWAMTVIQQTAAHNRGFFSDALQAIDGCTPISAPAREAS